MKNKIIGIFVVMLLISIVLPITATTVDDETRFNSYVITGPCDLSFYEMNNDENLLLIRSNNGEPTSFVGSNGNDDQIDQQQQYPSGFSWGVYGEPAKLAQSFKPTLEILTRVKARLSVWGSPDGLEISIRDNLNGSDLTSLYIPTDEMSITNFWAEFDFPDIVVIPEQTYYIVWDPVGSPNIYNTFYWDLQDKNPYEKGCAWKYLSETWQKLEIDVLPYGNPDFCFKTYGKANSPPNKPSTPSGPITGDIGDSLHYESYFSDPDGGDMSVIFDWDDGTDSGWIELGSDGTIGSYHSWSSNGTYKVRAKAKDPYFESEWSEPLTVIIGNLPPNKPRQSSGPTSGKAEASYSYSSSTTDPDGDQVWYKWDWEDEISGWIGPFDSGDTVNASHVWDEKGEYSIKVKAKDVHGEESPWSDPLSVSMPRNKVINSFLLFLEGLIERFPMLEQIL